MRASQARNDIHCGSSCGNGLCFRRCRVRIGRTALTVLTASYKHPGKTGLNPISPGWRGDSRQGPQRGRRNPHPLETVWFRCDARGASLAPQGRDPCHDRRLRGSLDSRFFGPAEVETPLGDPAKARERLGWQPRIRLEEMVAEMARADLREAESDMLCKKRLCPRARGLAPRSPS